jgi:hypothetical protein
MPAVAKIRSVKKDAVYGRSVRCVPFTNKEQRPTCFLMSSAS